MEKKIRVLIVVPSLKISSGVSSFAINYYRQINHNHIQTDFALIKDTEPSYQTEIMTKGGRCFVLSGLKHIKNHLKICKTIISQGNYDIIHINTLLPAIPIMLYARRHVPIRILHSHNAALGETRLKGIRNRLFVPLLRNLSTDYAACSDKAGRVLFDNRPYKIIPNIISEKAYCFSEEKRTTIRKEMNISPETIIIGTVGRTAPQKNPLFALKVISGLTKKHSNILYWWIGSGPLEKEFLEETDRLGLQDRVQYLGSREDIIDLYHAMDLFFLPSLFEGLPLTGVEAQAMGLPCIISDTVSRELVYTNLIEFVSLKRPVKEWVEIIESQFAKRKNRRGRLENLRKSIYSEYVSKNKLEDYYTILMNKSKK